MNDSFIPQVETEGIQTQGQPADGAAQPDTASALAFLGLTPTPVPGQAPGAAADEPYTSDSAPRTRLTGLSPQDAAVLEYAKEHNRENPQNRISLAQAAAKLGIAVQPEAPRPHQPQQPVPPVDFNAQFQRCESDKRAVQAALAQASEAGDHAKVADLTAHLTELMVEGREIHREANEWKKTVAWQQENDQAQHLSSAHSADFGQVQQQFPGIDNPSNPARQAFDALWAEKAAAGDPVLKSPNAPSLIMGQVAMSLGLRPGQQQQQPNPGYAPHPAANRPSYPTYPVTPGSAYPGAVRQAPPQVSQQQVADMMLRGELTTAQLDQLLNHQAAQRR